MEQLTLLVKSCVKISRSIQFCILSEYVNFIVEENVSSTVPPIVEKSTVGGVAATPEDEKGIFENIGKLMLIYSRRICLNTIKIIVIMLLRDMMTGNLTFYCLYLKNVFRCISRYSSWRFPVTCYYCCSIRPHQVRIYLSLGELASDSDILFRFRFGHWQ